MGNLTISVIVPTYKAAGCLPNLLESLWTQALKPLEIILIDSSSPDGTAEIAKQAGCVVQVIPQSEFNHGATRNFGAKMARGEVLVFLTQDVLPVDQWFLEKLVGPIAAGTASIAFARQIPYPNASPTESFTRSFNYPAQSYVRSIEDLPRFGFKTYYLSNAASAVSKRAFVEIGRFAEDLILSEETHLCMRLLQAGHRLAYQAEAQVYHSHRYTLAQQFRRLFDTGVFHARHRQMLKGAAPEGEGLQFLTAQISHLLGQRAWGWAMYAVLEAAAKFTGFQLGKREALLPNSLKERLSMHPGYFRR